MNVIPTQGPFRQWLVHMPPVHDKPDDVCSPQRRPACMGAAHWQEARARRCVLVFLSCRDVCGLWSTFTLWLWATHRQGTLRRRLRIISNCTAYREHACRSPAHCCGGACSGDAVHRWLMSCRHVQGRLPHPALRTMHGTIFASAEMASAIGVRDMPCTVIEMECCAEPSRFTMQILYIWFPWQPICVETHMDLSEPGQVSVRLGARVSCTTYLLVRICDAAGSDVTWTVCNGQTARLHCRGRAFCVVRVQVKARLSVRLRLPRAAACWTRFLRPASLPQQRRIVLRYGQPSTLLLDSFAPHDVQRSCSRRNWCLTSRIAGPESPRGSLCRLSNPAPKFPKSGCTCVHNKKQVETDKECIRF